MSTLKLDPFALGVALIIGAAWYSRQAKAATVKKPAGTGSMPGNVGSGANQVAGGIFGSLTNLLADQLKTGVFRRDTPLTVQPGTSYDPSDPAYVGGVGGLINGTIHDAMTGDTSSYNIPTVNDIVLDVTNTTYGGDSGALDSIVKIPGALW